MLSLGGTQYHVLIGHNRFLSVHFYHDHLHLLFNFIGHQIVTAGHQALLEVRSWHIWLAYTCLYEPFGWIIVSLC